jgi:hypothetical protein
MGQTFKKLSSTTDLIFTNFTIFNESSYYTNNPIAADFFEIDDLVFLLNEYGIRQNEFSYGTLITESLKSKHIAVTEYVLEQAFQKLPLENYYQFVFNNLICPKLDWIQPQPYNIQNHRHLGIHLSEIMAQTIIENLSPRMRIMFIAIQCSIFANYWFHLLPEFKAGHTTKLSCNCFEADVFTLITIATPPRIFTAEKPLFYDIVAYIALCRVGKPYPELHGSEVDLLIHYERALSKYRETLPEIIPTLLESFKEVAKYQGCFKDFSKIRTRQHNFLLYIDLLGSLEK